MPVTGEPFPVQIFAYDAEGEGVPALVEADITLHALLDDAEVVLVVADFTEIGDGYYVATITTPTTRGRLRIDISLTDPADGTADPDVLEGDITAFDIDDVASIAARPPSITLASNVGKDAAFTIEVFKGDARTLRIPVYDEDGNLRDVSAWNSFRFSIQNAAQTVDAPYLPYDQTSAITGGVGYVDIALPESCSFYDLITTATVRAYWSLDGDPNDNTLTQTLRAGIILGKRKETPSP